MDSTMAVKVLLTGAALLVAGWRWVQQWRAQTAAPGALGGVGTFAFGTSDRDTIGLALAAGIVLAEWGAARMVELVAWVAGVTGLDAEAWAPAGADTIAVAVFVGAVLDVGVVGLWRGIRVLEALKRRRLFRRFPGLLGPSLRHSVIALLVPALFLAGAPLLAQTTTDAVHAIGNAPAPAVCAPADQPATAVAGEWGKPERLANAATIVQVGREMGVPERGQWIAVATAMQESGLRNIDYGDRDSLGLFQQRPSQGWGTPAEVRDPRYAATQFYDRLLAIPGWEELPLWQAAQAVQRSAYPTAYAEHADVAALLVGAAAGSTCTSERS
jgi:hypothetical protein